MIVVDASLAAKWVVVEPDSDVAERILEDFRARRELVVAPHLLPFELTNILRQKMRREGMSWETAENALRDFLAVRVRLEPRLATVREQLYREALRLATRFDLPSAYDAHYLALAEHLGCELWTADERLVRALAGRAPFVRRLADHPAR